MLSCKGLEVLCFTKIQFCSRSHYVLARIHLQEYLQEKLATGLSACLTAGRHESIIIQLTHILTWRRKRITIVLNIITTTLNKLGLSPWLSSSIGDSLENDIPAHQNARSGSRADVGTSLTGRFLVYTLYKFCVKRVLKFGSLRV
jgi:hypothetical protein